MLSKERMVWYLRQLLPLKYESNYRDGNDVRWHCVWRMWFGKPFDITHTRV